MWFMILFANTYNGFLCNGAQMNTEHSESVDNALAHRSHTNLQSADKYFTASWQSYYSVLKPN